MEPTRTIKTITTKFRKHTDSTKSLSQTSLASSEPQSAQYTTVTPAYGNSRPRKLLYIASFKLTVFTILSPGHFILHYSLLPTAPLDRQPSVVVVEAKHRARNSTHLPSKEEIRAHFGARLAEVQVQAQRAAAAQNRQATQPGMHAVGNVSMASQFQSPAMAGSPPALSNGNGFGIPYRYHNPNNNGTGYYGHPTQGYGGSSSPYSMMGTAARSAGINRRRWNGSLEAVRGLGSGCC